MRIAWVAAGLLLGCAEPSVGADPQPPPPVPVVSVPPGRSPAAASSPAGTAAARAQGEVDWATHCHGRSAPADGPPPLPVAAVDRAPFRPAFAVAYFRPEATEAAAEAAATAVGGRVDFFGNGWTTPGGVPSRVPKFTRLAVPNGEERAATDRLRQSPDVVAAWPDYARAAPSPLRSRVVLRRGREAWEAGVVVVGFAPGPTSTKPSVDAQMASFGHRIVQYTVDADGVRSVLVQVTDCHEDAAAARLARGAGIRFAEKNHHHRLTPR